MFFPIGLSVSLARFPWANFILILVITTVSILAWIDQDLMIQLSGATVVGSGPFEVWAFHRPVASWPDYAVSASFLHADVLHLLGNMLFLYLFGTAMNAKLGHIRYLLLYFASAIFSGCLFYATSDGAAVGASGAIMGVVGAFAVMYPLNEVRVFYWVTYFLTGTFEISAYWVLGFYIGFDIFNWITDDAPVVAYAAHVGGFALGFAVMLTLLKLGWITPNRDERTLLQAFAGEAEPEMLPYDKPATASSSDPEP